MASRKRIGHARIVCLEGALIVGGEEGGLRGGPDPLNERLLVEELDLPGKGGGGHGAGREIRGKAFGVSDER